MATTAEATRVAPVGPADRNEDGLSATTLAPAPEVVLAWIVLAAIGLAWATANAQRSSLGVAIASLVAAARVLMYPHPAANSAEPRTTGSTLLDQEPTPPPSEDSDGSAQVPPPTRTSTAHKIVEDVDCASCMFHAIPPEHRSPGETTPGDIDQAVDQFLSSISHELRTPLTSILASSEIIGLSGEDPATREEFLGIIDREANRLLRILSLMLDMTKVKAGRFKLRKRAVRAEPLLDEAVGQIREAAATRDVRVRVEVADDARVLCDHDRMNLVLHSMLTNAVRRATKGTEILCRARQAALESTIEITLSPQQELGPIDDETVLNWPFRSTIAGLEVAPRIASDIVEAHGGRLTLAPDLGTITLPMTEEPDDSLVR